MMLDKPVQHHFETTAIIQIVKTRFIRQRPPARHRHERAIAQKRMDTTCSAHMLVCVFDLPDHPLANAISRIGGKHQQRACGAADISVQNRSHAFKPAT